MVVSRAVFFLNVDVVAKTRIKWWNKITFFLIFSSCFFLEFLLLLLVSSISCWKKKNLFYILWVSFGSFLSVVGLLVCLVSLVVGCEWWFFNDFPEPRINLSVSFTRFYYFLFIISNERKFACWMFVWSVSKVQKEKRAHYFYDSCFCGVCFFEVCECGSFPFNGHFTTSVFLRLFVL